MPEHMPQAEYYARSAAVAADRKPWIAAFKAPDFKHRIAMSFDAWQEAMDWISAARVMLNSRWPHDAPYGTTFSIGAYGYEFDLMCRYDLERYAADTKFWQQIVEALAHANRS